MGLKGKKLYIAKLIGFEEYEYGDKPVYDTPKEYYFMYMPLSEADSYKDYGLEIVVNQRSYVNLKTYKGIFKVGDRVYLEDSDTIDIDTLVENETENGSNANYEISVSQLQRMKIELGFKKISSRRE